MSKYIKLLEESSINEIGTKMANLKTIQTKTNYQVPKTLVLTSSFYNRLMLENKIRDPQNYNWKKIKIPVELESELFDKIKEVFGSKNLVIRSSASCEDSPLLSFAGQYSSFLNIKGKEKTLKAIRLCFASLFSKNAVIYSKLNDLDLRKVYMAVAIQEVAEISRSGVMFTINPVTKNMNELLIEYGEGLGDKIVGGGIAPHLAKIQKGRLKNTKQIFLRSISKMGLEIEKVFGCPQDIEWGYNKDNLYIFQSRPITTLKIIPNNAKNIRLKRKIGTGIATSPGTSIGRFKIIASANDYKTIQTGDIIVVLTSPDIKLIENLNKIAGMIIPGGLLSHFAVIAREFSKPCITQMKNFNYAPYKNKNIYLDASAGKLYLTY